MSTRTFYGPHSVIADGNMSADVTSSVTILEQMSGISYDCTWTGTPTGVVSVEISNTVTLDAAGEVSSSGTWTTIPGASLNPAGSADHGFINVAGLEGYAVRLVYTRTSGSGTLNATVCGKVQ